MSFNINQALLLVDRWQRARKRKFGDGLRQKFERQDDVEEEQEQGFSNVDADGKNAKGVRQEDQEKVILNSYWRGATPERISRVSKIPLETVKKVIAKGND